MVRNELVFFKKNMCLLCGKLVKLFLILVIYDTTKRTLTISTVLGGLTLLLSSPLLELHYNTPLSWH